MFRYKLSGQPYVRKTRRYFDLDILENVMNKNNLRKINM